MCSLLVRSQGEVRLEIRNKCRRKIEFGTKRSLEITVDICFVVSRKKRQY
jgi:hypothetical protein